MVHSPPPQTLPLFGENKPNFHFASLFLNPGYGPGRNDSTRTVDRITGRFITRSVHYWNNGRFITGCWSFHYSVDSLLGRFITHVYYV